MTQDLRRRRVSRYVFVCASLVAALAYGCGGSDSPTTPNGTGPIRVIAGGGQTDTIMVTLAQPLVVEIHDSTKRIAPGVTVRFESLGSRFLSSVLVAPLGQQSFDYIGSSVTDAQGRVKMRVRLGNRAGTARLEVSVPELGVVDTVEYTITAGALKALWMMPGDTTIAPGSSYTVRTYTTDQWNNPVAGVTPTYSGTGVTVSSSGQVTAGNGIVRGRVIASYRELRDTIDVSVVPRLPMVAASSGMVSLINSDGSGSITLATTQLALLSVSSVPATPSVVFAQGDQYFGADLWIAQPNVAARPLFNAPKTHFDAWPRLSPDGEWVYFVRDKNSLWRVKLDGTGLDSLASFAPVRGYSAPTVAPDGRSVAIEDSTGLTIVDVATKVTRTLPVTCGFPRYSPDGAFFACAAQYTVSIVGTDGTGQRVVAQLDAYFGPDDSSGVDWTPDGKWLLTRVRAQYALLVEVSSGTIVPLGGLPFYSQLSFVR